MSGEINLPCGCLEHLIIIIQLLIIHKLCTRTFSPSHYVMYLNVLQLLSLKGNINSYQMLRIINITHKRFRSTKVKKKLHIEDPFAYFPN